MISCSSNITESKVHYKVTPSFQEKKIDVQFSQASDENGNLVLIYENESMGESNLMNCLQNLNVTPEASNIEIIRDSSLIKIYGKPNQTYKISYSIIKDYKQAPLNQYRYRPIVDSTYFHVLGTKLFVYPASLFPNQEAKVSISIDWFFKNKNDVFHSSFGFNRKQRLNISQNELYASFFVGGDFRRYEFQYKNKPVYFVSRGNLSSIDDNTVLEILKKTIKNQHDFWKDSIHDQFSVSLIPTYEKNHYSIGGSALTNSFISYASNNVGTTQERMTWLYNHELMHKWIGRTIQIEKDVVEYWFSEGFTDYYAYKLMLKNNVINAEEYINILNHKVLIPHYKDKVANVPNSELTFQNYWSNYGTYAKLPYRRGLLYAFLIDNQIKKQTNFTKSLDDVMFDLYRKSKSDRSFRVNKTIFLEYLSKYLENVYATKEFTKYILEGDFINFENNLFDGLKIEKNKKNSTFKINTQQNNRLLDQLKC